MSHYVAIVFLSFAGFLLAAYLRQKKKSKKHFVCPLKAKCDTVIHSPYSKFLGVPVELLGMAYYGLVAIGYGVKLANGDWHALSYALLAATGLAFFFSLYLTFVQVFSLREYCSWCLFSAFLCTVIFAIALVGSLESVVPFLQEYKTIIVILHALAAAVGLGAATLGDMFFLRFLKDFRISQHESDVLSMISQVIWAALAVIFVTGLGIFLSDVQMYSESVKFLVKVTIVLIITVNGAMLNLLVAPRLVQISFGEKHHHKKGELHRLRNMAFAFGPVSVVSWYTVFVLGLLKSVPFSYGVMMLLYAGLVAVGVIGGELLERRLDAMARNAKKES